jgi:uncharacterized protein (TIGR00297 family)
MLSSNIILFENEWFVFITLFLIFLLFIFITETAYKKKVFSSNVNRRLIHIIVGCFASFSPFIFNNNYYPILLAVIFMIINIFAIKNGQLKGIHSVNRVSWGTIFFPLSFLIISLFFWGYPEFVIFCFLILAIADPIASIVGEAIEDPIIFRVWKDKKTLEGSILFFTVSFFILYIGSNLLFQAPNFYHISFSIFVALGTTIAEITSNKGSDNFSIPIIGMLFMIAFNYSFSEVLNIKELLESKIFIFTLSLISLLLLSYRLKALSLSGAFGAIVMGILIINLNSFYYLLPLSIFFVFSSILSQVIKKSDFYVTKTSQRDLIQVFANGGIPLLICIYDHFSPNSLNFFLFSASISAAMSDTWGTELGKLSKVKPVSIITLKRIKHGESGGITRIGTIGSFLGASIIGLTASILFPSTSNTIIFGIIISGFIAALFDSIIGATLQGKFKIIKTGKIIETEDGNTIHFSGKRWITNDIVNLSNTILSPIILLILIMVLK